MIGIGPSGANVGSDSDSDDDDIEWIPGSDDGGGASGAGVNRSAGMSELGGTGGRLGQAAPVLPGGRKCVSVLFRHPLPSFSLKYEIDADDCASIFFFLLFSIFIPFSNIRMVSHDHPDCAATATDDNIFPHSHTYRHAMFVPSMHCNYGYRLCCVPNTGCRPFDPAGYSRPTLPQLELPRLTSTRRYFPSLH